MVKSSISTGFGHHHPLSCYPHNLSQRGTAALRSLTRTASWWSNKRSGRIFGKGSGMSGGAFTHRKEVHILWVDDGFLEGIISYVYMCIYIYIYIIIYIWLYIYIYISACVCIFRAYLELWSTPELCPGALFGRRQGYLRQWPSVGAGPCGPCQSFSPQEAARDPLEDVYFWQSWRPVWFTMVLYVFIGIKLLYIYIYMVYICFYMVL